MNKLNNLIKVFLPLLIPILFVFSSLLDEQFGTNLDRFFNPIFQIVIGILLAYYLSVLNNNKKYYWPLASLFILMGVLNALFVTEYKDIISYVFWLNIAAFISIYLLRFLNKVPKSLLDLTKLVVITLFVASYTSNPIFALPAFIHPLSFFLMIVIFFFDYYYNRIEVQRINYRSSFLFWIILLGGIFMGVLVVATYLISSNI